MGVLDNDVFDKVIQIRDRYQFSTLIIREPPLTGFDSYIYRGFDWLNQKAFFKNLRAELMQDIMDGSIMKVNETTHNFAYIKKCILKHIATGTFRYRWKTDKGYGLGNSSYKNPSQIDVILEGRMNGEWQTVIHVGIRSLETYNEWEELFHAKW